jgi:hypothetical protein
MDPLLIAARFAAFTCYLNTRTSEPSLTGRRRKVRQRKLESVFALCPSGIGKITDHRIDFFGQTIWLSPVPERKGA